METYFTSDHHFGHKAVIGYSGRPFVDVPTMDATMIEKWNARVAPGDVVYHLGDVSFHRLPETQRILGALNGTIRLVKGNHDKLVRKPVIASRFEWVKDYFELEVGEQRLVLCHYPFLTWNKGHYGSWMLHGHSHGSLGCQGTTRMDIGVDTHDFVPWHFEEIRDVLGAQVYRAVDHHGQRGEVEKDEDAEIVTEDGDGTAPA